VTPPENARAKAGVRSCNSTLRIAIRSRARMKKGNVLGFVGSFLMVVLAGCALMPVDGPPYTAAPPSVHGDAIIYLYRTKAYPLCCRPTIYIDNVTIFEPRQNSYTWIYVQQGQHKLSIEWAWTTAIADEHCNLVVKPGEAYFIHLRSSSFPFPLGSRDVVRLKLVDEPEAERELQQCCRYVAPDNGHIHPGVPVKVPARFCGGEHWESRF